jgi:hypothetical protein
VNDCGVRNHDVANAIHVAVLSRYDKKAMYPFFASDASEGCILQKRER